MLKRATHWLTIPAHTLNLIGMLIPVAFVSLFAYTYREQFPIASTVLHNLDVALAIKDGTFTPALLMQPGLDGHRLVVPKIITAIITVTTNWNIMIEQTLLLVLAFLSLLLTVALFARTNSKLAHVVMIPFAALFFTTNPGDAWTDIAYICWQLTTFCTLLAIHLLYWRVHSWSAVIAAGFLSLTALFAFTLGAIAWGVCLVAMIFAGYRRWQYYAAFIGMAIASFALFWVTGSGIQFAGQPDIVTSSTVTLPEWGTYLQFFVVYLGSPIAFRSASVATTAGIIAIAMLLLDGVYLLLNGRRRTVFLWMPVLAYAVSSGLVIALGRHTSGIEPALWERYTLVGSFVWIVMVALSVDVLDLIQKKALWQKLLFTLVHGVVLSAATMGYIYTAYIGTEHILEADRFSLPPYPASALLDHYDCVREYPLTRTGNCISEGELSSLKADKLAAYNMSGYMHRERQNILSDSTGTVIVHTHDAWLSLHIRNWLLDGVPAERVLLLIPPEEQNTVDTHFAALPNPPQQIVTTSDAAQAFTSPNESVTVVSRGVDAFELTEGFAIAERRTVPYDLTITRYERLPEDLSAPTVDDSLSLVGWSLPQGITVQACDTVTLHTFWALTEPLAQNYTLAVVAANASGMGIAQVDRPFDVPTSTWEPNRHYFDAQQITIPCETPTGDYPLLLDVYTTKAENLIYLTTLIVQ